MADKVIVLGSEYVSSAVKKAQYPKDELPAVAFIGRSNVGKSSLINSLLNRKNLARTSQTPGKTQTINFYKVDLKIFRPPTHPSGVNPQAPALEPPPEPVLEPSPDPASEAPRGTVEGERRAFYVVDLPGYGYAKTSKSNRTAWLKFIDEYFSSARNLLFACLLVDIRHAPMDSDLDMFNRLVRLGVPVLVTATKADKISHAAQERQLDLIKQTFGIAELDVLPYSSTKNEGRSDLLDVIADCLLQ